MLKRKVSRPRTMSEVLRRCTVQTVDASSSQLPSQVSLSQVLLSKPPPQVPLSQPSSQAPLSQSSSPTTPQVPPSQPSSPATPLLPSLHMHSSQPTIVSESRPATFDLARSKRGRGQAKGIREWGTGVKVEVQFDATFEPVGDRAAALKGQLGHIVRNGHRVPLTYINWNSVPKDVIESIWKEVKDNLKFAPEGFKQVCLDACNKMWKDHKSRTKSKFYVPFKTYPDISSRVPLNIIPEQWRELVEYWGSKEAEEIANRNSKNRKLRGITHTTGRKHFSQICYEMKKNGESTDKMSIFIKTRRKDDPEVALLVTQFNERLSKVPEHLRTIDIHDQIFCELVGKDGKSYCQTYSSAMPRSALDKRDTNPSYVFNHSTIVEIAQQVKEEVKEKFRSEIEQLKARITFLESQGGNVDVSRQVSDASSEHLFRESVGDDIPQSQQDSPAPSPSS